MTASLRTTDPAQSTALGQAIRWKYVAATLLGFAVWVSLFPLTILDIVPLWAAFVVFAQWFRRDDPAASRSPTSAATLPTT